MSAAAQPVLFNVKEPSDRSYDSATDGEPRQWPCDSALACDKVAAWSSERHISLRSSNGGFRRSRA